MSSDDDFKSSSKRPRRSCDSRKKNPTNPDEAIYPDSSDRPLFSKGRSHKLVSSNATFKDQGRVTTTRPKRADPRPRTPLLREACTSPDLFDAENTESVEGSDVTCEPKDVAQDVTSEPKDVSQVVTRKDVTRQGFCPFCQVPFSALSKIESSSWHVSLCLSSPTKNQPECERGRFCNCTIPSHYKKFKHSALAKWRDAGWGNRADADGIPDIGLQSEPGFTKVQAIKTSSTQQNGFSLQKVFSQQKELSQQEEAQQQHIKVSQPQNLKKEEVEFVIGEDDVDFSAEEDDRNDTDENPFQKRMKENVSVKTQPKAPGNKQTLLSNFFSLSPKKSKQMEVKNIHPPKLSNPKREVDSPTQKISEESSNWLKNKTASFPKETYKTELKLKGGQNSKASTTSGGIGNTTQNNDNIQMVNKNAVKAATKTSRPCPFYKWIPSTHFTVDAFSFGQVPNCTFYFLSHFHADHYKGLNKKFAHGKVVCSKVTANLVKAKLGVVDFMILSASVNETIQVENALVTLIEANHCPGAVLFMFQLQDGKTFLHTGDFRADSNMLEHPSLKPLIEKSSKKRLTSLFLDTTYCDPNYSFPPQKDVIEFTINLAVDFVLKNPRTLVVSGTYTIGKERIFMAVAEALGWRVCVRADKMAILKCLEDRNMERILTLDKVKGRLHVLPMHMLNKRSLLEYLSQLRHVYDHVLAFKPTGWTFDDKAATVQHKTDDPKEILKGIKPICASSGITIYGVPYSEHSSFSELRMFVQAVRPAKIVPTVNVGNPQKRDFMQKTFKDWLDSV